MKRKLTLLVTALSAIAVSILVPAGSGAATGKITKVKCSGRFTNLNPGQTAGHYVGLPSCGKPLGGGIEWVAFKATVTPGGTVTISGHTKVWWDRGTISGPYSITGKFPAPASTLTGKGTIKHSSGAYKGSQGSATIKCTTTDGGATLNCTYTLRFTRF